MDLGWVPGLSVVVADVGCTGFVALVVAAASVVIVADVDFVISLLTLPTPQRLPPGILTFVGVPR